MVQIEHRVMIKSMDLGADGTGSSSFYVTELWRVPYYPWLSFFICKIVQIVIDDTYAVRMSVCSCKAPGMELLHGELSMLTIATVCGDMRIGKNFTASSREIFFFLSTSLQKQNLENSITLYFFSRGVLFIDNFYSF